MPLQSTARHIDPTVVAAHATFRAVMNAMARPGRIQRGVANADAPQQVMMATAALARALFDHDTPVWLDPAMRNAEVMQWLRFHTSAPIVDMQDQASFALIADMAMLPAIESFAFGTADYPDRSTTLIVQVNSLDAGSTWQLRGPGIDGTRTIGLDAGLHGLFTSLAINERTFPRGIDTVLVCGDALVAIPRTARIQLIER